MKYMIKARPYDIDYVAEHMRPEDIEECAAGGLSPLSALIIGWQSGDTWALITPLGDPCAILGVHETEEPGCGKIWMLGTPEIEKYPMTFLKNCRPVLDELFKDYKLLSNWSYYKNEVHHKWLQWLGFTLQDRCGDWIPFYKWKDSE